MLIVVTAFVACGKKDSGPQTWDFTLDTASGTSSTALVGCDDGGACPSVTWTLTTPVTGGCLLQISADARFSGTSVVLSNFQRAAASTCTGPSVPRPDAEGHGTADASWPSAQKASGQATLGFIGVLYIAGGPPPLAWRAQRLAP